MNRLCTLLLIVGFNSAFAQQQAFDVVTNGGRIIPMAYVIAIASDTVQLESFSNQVTSDIVFIHIDSIATMSSCNTSGSALGVLGLVFGASLGVGSFYSSGDNHNLNFAASGLTIVSFIGRTIFGAVGGYLAGYVIGTVVSPRLEYSFAHESREQRHRIIEKHMSRNRVPA